MLLADDRRPLMEAEGKLQLLAFLQSNLIRVIHNEINDQLCNLSLTAHQDLATSSCRNTDRLFRLVLSSARPPRWASNLEPLVPVDVRSDFHSTIMAFQQRG